MASIVTLQRELEAQRELFELILRSQQAICMTLTRIHGETQTPELRVMRAAIAKFLKENATTTLEL